MVSMFELIASTMIKNNACEHVKCSRRFTTNLATSVIKREGDDDDDDGGYDYAPAAWIVMTTEFMNIDMIISLIYT